MSEKREEKHDSGRESSPDVAAPIPEPVTPIVPDVPDGGLLAWLQVAGAAILFFNSWYVRVQEPYLISAVYPTV